MVLSGAKFSVCSKYRYALWRIWDSQTLNNLVMFIGLNPSTADEQEDDPTIRRCIRFSRDWGFSGLLMMNAYAFRATNPVIMKSSIDPVGPNNDEELVYYSRHIDTIVAAWGANCSSERENEINRLINKPICCLGKTKTGKPKHPLYLRADTKLEEFWTP